MAQGNGGMMIKVRELLANGWLRKWDALYKRAIYNHPKCWLKDVVSGEKLVVAHTLAQARWAHEHMVTKQPTKKG